jgi:hypothetical protein
MKTVIQIQKDFGNVSSGNNRSIEHGKHKRRPNQKSKIQRHEIRRVRFQS